MSCPTLQALLDEGVVVLYHDYRSGTFDDLSGNGNDGIPTAPTALNGRGMRLNQTGRLDVAADSSLDFSNSNECSMVCYFPEGYVYNPLGINYPLYFLNAATTSMFLTGNTFGLQVQATFSQNAVIPVGGKCIAVSGRAAEFPSFYKNGVRVADGTTVLPNFSAGNAIGRVGTPNSYIRQIPSTFGAVIATNRALTATEHYNLYKELKSMTWPSKTWSRTTGQLCIDCSDTSLVAAYDMRPENGEIADLSGNGNVGTINGPVFENTEIGGSMRFDGVDDYIDCGAGFQALQDVTVSFWIHLREVTTATWALNYFASGSDAWGVRINTAAPGNATIALYDDIDDANTPYYTQTLTVDKEYLVTVQLDSLENKMYIDGQLVGNGSMAAASWDSFAGILYIGKRSDSLAPTPCNISRLKVYNRALSASEIAAEYECGATAINWKTDYGATESTAAESAPGELSNTPFRKESGTWKISTDTINGESCKVIECVTSGVLQVPSAYFFGGDVQGAYGTWEWWMLKGAGANSSDIGIIGNQPSSVVAAGYDGYTLTFNNAERVQLRRLTSGSGLSLLFTDAAYIDNGTWYMCKITRSPDGEFTVYLNNNIVDVTGGGGTNPVTDTTHTTSKYIVLDLDAGDKVAYASKNGGCSIVKYQGVV